MVISAPRQQFRKCAHCGLAYAVPIGPGRPRAHCSDKCRYASKKSGPPDHAEQDQDLLDVTDDLQLEVTRLMAERLAARSSQQLLRQVITIRNLLEDTEAAIIARGRVRSESWKEMADGTGSSPDHLRKKWTPDRVHRRVARVRKARASRAAHTAAPSTVSVPRQRTGSDTTDDSHDDVPLLPSQPPGQQLATALSFLQRKTQRSIKETALDMGISPSHLSRVLAGTRGPSWHVVEQFAAVCQADLNVLRTLWESAQRPPGHSPAPPPTNPDVASREFHIVLKSLFVAAGSPDLWTIQRISGIGRRLSISEIARTLNGGQLPEWETAARIILALRGCPAELRPLWQAAQPRTSAPNDPTPDPA